MESECANQSLLSRNSPCVADGGRTKVAIMKRRRFLQASGGTMAGYMAAGLFARDEGRDAGLTAGVRVRSLVPSAELVNNALHSNMTVRFDERGSPLQVKA